MVKCGIVILIGEMYNNVIFNFFIFSLGYKNYM